MYEEEEGQELPVENEDLVEHQRAKDTHRQRRIDKEKEKQKKEWRQSKPRGKRRRFDADFDDDFHYWYTFTQRKSNFFGTYN